MAPTSFSDRRKTWFLVTVALALAPTIAAIEPTTDGVATTQAIIQAAFPELMSEKYKVVVTLDVPQMRLAWNASKHLVARVSRQESSGDIAAEISAEFWLTGTGLDQASLQGTFVKTDEYRALVRRLESHPEWTEDQMAVEAFSAGAEFIPPQVSPSRIGERVHRLDGALGGIKNYWPRFDWRTLGRVGAVWVIDLETASGQCYTMELEPFTGHLVHLSLTQCRVR